MGTSNLPFAGLLPKLFLAELQTLTGEPQMEVALQIERLLELSNERVKFKRMFEAEARKSDHISTLS
jgi:hypothetical protein